MKSQHVHQEVLILTNTALSQKSLCSNKSSEKNSSVFSGMEEAFWSGLLNRLVPEVMSSIRHSRMVIWGVYAGEFYLLIDLAEIPGTTDSRLSIDPHLLLSEIIMN